MLGMGEARVRAFDARLLLLALIVSPVSKIGVDQFFERPLAFAVGRGEAVIIHQRMEAVSPPVPDVPDERPLLKKLAMLGEEAVTEPVVERLTGISRFTEQAGEFRSRPGQAKGVLQKRIKALGGDGFTL